MRQTPAIWVEPSVDVVEGYVTAELRAWLRRMHDEMHATSVFVTHDQEEAMELADRIVLMNRGRVEQAGDPPDLYERPANDFVMRFLGSVTSFGDLLLRPHDVEVRREPAASTREATVERLVHLGFEVRAELVLPDRQRLLAQLSRAEARELDLKRDQTVHVRPRRAPVFRQGPVGVPCWADERRDQG
jgi:sulfate transport system ATP-binding protein